MKQFNLTVIVLMLFTASQAQSNAHSEITRTHASTNQSVTFSSGRYQLSGKLITNAPANIKVPAIIFCVGSGESSYNSNYRKFLQYFFEENLSLDSVALFYFDKRGIGDSEGKWYKTSFEQRADDVKAAADFLAMQSFIDQSKIFVAGHSQGGWITQVALAKYPSTFAGGISMAGPTFSVRKQLVNDYTSKYMCAEGISEGAAQEKASRNVDRVLKFVSVFPIKPQWKQLKIIRNFNPTDYLRNVSQPLLMLFATNDALVNARWSTDDLHRMFDNNTPTHIETSVISGATHDFQIDDLCGTGRRLQKAPYSEETRIALRNWLHQNMY